MIFEKWNLKDRFVLLEGQDNTPQHYPQPVKFIIFDKISGITSLENTDIEYVIRQRGMIE